MAKQGKSPFISKEGCPSFEETTTNIHEFLESFKHATVCHSVNIFDTTHSHQCCNDIMMHWIGAGPI